VSFKVYGDKTAPQWRRHLKGRLRDLQLVNVSVRGPWSSGGDRLQLAVAGSREAPLPAHTADRILAGLLPGCSHQELLAAWYAASEHDLATGVWADIVARKRAAYLP